MNDLEITSTLTVADWRAYQSAWASRLQSQSRLSRQSLVGAIAISAVMATALVLLARYFEQSVPFAAVAIGACAASLGIILSMRRMRTAAQPDEDGVVLGPSQVSFDMHGMRLRKNHSDIRHDWAVMQGVTETSEHLFVWIDRVAGLIVPVRDLPQGLSAREAADRIRALAAGASTKPAASSPHEHGVAQVAAPAAAATARGFGAAIARLLTLRMASPDAIALNDRAAASLALMSVALWLVIDRMSSGPNAEFYSYGLVGVGWCGFILWLVAFLWSRLSAPRADLRSTTLIALGFVPLAVILIALALHYLPPQVALGAVILIAVYASWYGHTGLHSVTSQHQPRAVFAGLLVMSAAAWFSEFNYVSPKFWYPPEEEGSTADGEAYLERWRQLESLLLEQAERIDTTVATLERPAGLPAAAFFVGFAGMGEERVFAGEIDLAARVIAEKYDTSTRSLELVNDRRDLTSHPFATASALRRTLSGIARRMDLDNDVLFLALASHGSQDGKLSVSNGGAPMNPLDAAELADALNESGIRWRVIFISACYSGQFIPALRNDRTIVITAAAADRTSFGCSDDRDLTYFGEAFYRDTLPDAEDLRGAFQRTKALIDMREKAEGVESSNPQAHFGRAMERHLRAFARPQPSPARYGSTDLTHHGR